MKKSKLSIKHYALGFIILYVVIFLISSFIALSDIKVVNRSIEKAHYNNGKNELLESIQLLVSKHQKITREFTQWDEVHQQLSHPEYYIYWQTHRLFNANILPESFVEAAIYNKNGKVLDKHKASTLPNQISTDDLNAFINIENSIPYLILIENIYDQDKPEEVLGYAMTKSKIIAPLKMIKQFNDINSESIKSYFMEKKHIPVKNFIDYLKFDMKPNVEIQIFSKQLSQAVIRNTLILIGFALLFYFLITFFIAQPLRKISTYIDTLNNNPEFQYMPEVDVNLHINELEKVQSSINEYHSKLQAVYLNLDDKNKELWNMAHHDALTGTLNRRAFEEQWKKVNDLFSESRCNVSLILFDVNHFKSINDSYGHPVGDEVLKRISQAIEETLRKGEKLYRIGGDEFATIIYNSEPEDAYFIANRCRHAVSLISFDDKGIKEPIRASIGVAHNNRNDASISDLLWQADIAVYQAKKPGQADVISYSEALKNASESVLSSWINSRVFDALETGDGISMYYQPIVDLQKEKVSYYEALLRITSDNNEIIHPGEVFRLIEARKLEYEMDVAIFKRIARDLKLGVIPMNQGVSINVSGPSIIHHEIIEQLSQFVSFLSHYKIVLEITETSLITHISQATDNINTLKRMGFKIALDDFGSGYSSISYLSSMPVDIVKFDISLIRQLDNNKQYSIIKHLTAMIGETGQLLVAEGIETDDLKDKVKQLGFNFAQGYLFGKPSPTITQQ